MAKQQVRAQAGEGVSRWKNGVEKLYDVAAEIRKKFQIMNCDYLTAIERIDFPARSSTVILHIRKSVEILEMTINMSLRLKITNNLQRGFTASKVWPW